MDPLLNVKVSEEEGSSGTFSGNSGSVHGVSPSIY